MNTEVLKNIISNIPKSKVTTKPENLHLIPEKYRDFARNYEKQFAEYMVDQMDKTVTHSDTSTAGNYYRSLINKEMAGQMAKHNNGLGLQNMILDQVYPRRFRNEITYNAMLNKSNDKNKVSIQKNTIDPRPSIYKAIQNFEKIQGQTKEAIQ